MQPRGYLYEFQPLWHLQLLVSLWLTSDPRFLANNICWGQAQNISRLQDFTRSLEKPNGHNEGIEHVENIWNNKHMEKETYALKVSCSSLLPPVSSASIKALLEAKHHAEYLDYEVGLWKKRKGCRIIFPFVTLQTDILIFYDLFSLPNFSASSRSNKLLADQPWLSWMEAESRRVRQFVSKCNMFKACWHDRYYHILQ